MSKLTIIVCFLTTVSVLILGTAMAHADSKMRVGVTLTCRAYEYRGQGKPSHLETLRLRTQPAMLFGNDRDKNLLAGSIAWNITPGFGFEDLRGPITLIAHPEAADYGQVIFKSKYVSFSLVSQRLKDLLDKKVDRVSFGSGDEELAGNLERGIDSRVEKISLSCTGGVYNLLDMTVKKNEIVNKTDFVSIANVSVYGEKKSIVVDRRGFSLYTFRIPSMCINVDCLAQPMLVDPSAKIELPFGTFLRSDGKNQLTLNGRPLFYSPEDKKPRQAFGQHYDLSVILVEDSLAL